MGPSSVFNFCVVSCVVCFARGVRSEDESLRDDLRTLKGQVTALLERRQEDFNVLEDSIRRSLDKNSELAVVKSQLEELRGEIQKLKGGKKPTLNEQKNDHLTVQWLSSAISELRAELAEISATNNSSVEMQQREEMASGLDLLRGDVASFRRDLEELRAEQQQTVVTLGQLKQDVESSMKNSQAAATTTTATKTQVDDVKSEMSSFSKSLTKLSRDVKLLKFSISKLYDAEEDDAHAHDSDDRKYRHNRLIRQQISSLQKSEKLLRDKQIHLDHIVRKLERQLKAGLVLRNPRDNEAIDERLVERVGRLEEADRNAAKQMFNISRQVAELEHLQQSMFQLLETVEGLESKVDKNIPELQKEISKMEFKLSEATTSLTFIKENQESHRLSLNSLTEDLGRMAERLDTGDAHLSALQAQILNVSRYQRGGNESYDLTAVNARLAALENKLKDHLMFQNKSPTVGNDTVDRGIVPELIKSLQAAQKEFDNMVRQLPRDCGAVKGPSGVYAIAPGEGPPLLVYCNMSVSSGDGWTIFQRRVEGSVDFNRKWKEYAEGFGTPSDEFWLGNEALHRLTSENCSSLRIDFKDIYGTNWYAEYENFYVSDVLDGYRLHVDGFQGNASDALDYQNNMQFSSVDSDRDISRSHCAENYECGWWFSHCQRANLNGKYNVGMSWLDTARNEWIAVTFSEMKVRRRQNCGS